MKKGKKVNTFLFIVFGLVFCIGGVFSQKAEADSGFRFQPRADVSWLDYTFVVETSPALGEGPDLKFGDNLAAVNLGGTFFLRKFYLDLSYLHTSKGNFGVSRGFYVEATPYNQLPLDGDATTVGSGDFYHWESAITVGYQLLDKLTLYAGYKNNNTSIDLTLQTLFHFIDDGSITGTPGFPLSFSLEGDFEIDYDAAGPFLGGTYGFIIGEKGMLSLNLAVAFLDGDLTQTGRYIDPRTGSIDETFNINTTGDSIGFSYGVGWRSSLTDRLGYYMSVKGYNYNFDADDSDKSDFQEITYQFSLGLSYKF